MSAPSIVAALAIVGAVSFGPIPADADITHVVASDQQSSAASVGEDLTGANAPLDPVGEGLSPAAKRFENGQGGWQLPVALPAQDQTIDWSSCGEFTIAQSDELECGYLIAPADYSDASSPSVAIGLVRHRARITPSKGVLLINPGGPGRSGMEWLADKHNNLSETLNSFDLIGMDPRGVGNSVPVIRCLSNAARDIYRAGADRAAESVDLQRARREFQASECERHSGEGFAGYSQDKPFLRYVGTNNVVRDVERLRQVLGIERMNFLGYSYGTTIGYLYAREFPGTTGAVVLDGNVNHSGVARSVSRETKAEQPVVNRNLAAQMITSGGFGIALKGWARACLQGAESVVSTTQGCVIGPPVDDLTDERLEQGMGEIGSLVSEGWGTGVYYDSRDLSRPISAIDLAWGVRQALYAPESWSDLNDALVSLKRDGNATQLMGLSDKYFGRDEAGRYSQTYPALLVIACIDRSLPRMASSECEPFKESDPLIQGEALLPDIPIMNIAATKDPVTPYINGKVAAQLTRGHFLTVDQAGHSMYGAVSCVNEVVDAYLADPVGFETPSLIGTPCSLDRIDQIDPAKVRHQILSFIGITLIPMIAGFSLWLVERIELSGRLGG